MLSRQAQLEAREQRQRRVVEMHERGMNLHEIGEAIGRTPEMVRVILAQAERQNARIERWQQVQALAQTGNREELLAVPLDDVVFDPEDYRVRAVLANEGIETLRDLLDKHPVELIRYPNFGQRSLDAVRETLASLGLILNKPHVKRWLPPSLATLPVNSGWQLIETAPKDGTRILLFDQYDRERDYARFVGAYTSDLNGRGGSWYAIPGAYGKRPTHWMPLPEPPK